MLHLTDVRVGQTARDNVRQVLDSGRLSGGPMVPELERRMADLAGTDHAVAVSSATAGMGMLLTASGVRPGDRVVVPAFSFAATANVVVGVGAVPVFADVNDRLLLDDVDAEWVMPVHLYGQKAPVRDGWFEDAAQAVGMDVAHGVFSFYGSKTVGAGEGGMIVTDDPDVALRCVLWRNAGAVEPYRHVGFGLNFRMTELAAAVALGQLETLGTALALRERNAGILTERLAGIVGLPGGGLWHQYVIETDDRDRIRDDLALMGVESKPIYPYTLPDLPHLPDADVPRARRAAARNLALPVHEHLTVDEVRHIADAVAYAVDRT